MLPKTTTRVERNTAPEINARNRLEVERNIERYSGAGRPDLDLRIDELDREWDIERSLEIGAGTVSLLGLGLGAAVDRRWFLVPAAVGGFLLLHALQGWCPPVPVLRRLGVRTASEIEHERSALRAVRGDFDRYRHEPGEYGSERFDESPLL
jgi:hypothetical protein